MELVFVLAAESITRTDDQRFNIAGEFTTFGTTEFPAAHPSFWVLARLYLTLEETSRELRVSLTVVHAATGNPIANAQTRSGLVRLTEHQRAEMAAEADAMLQIDARFHLVGVVFPDPGRYLLEVSVEGEKVGSRRLAVRHLPAGAGE